MRGWRRLWGGFVGLLALYGGLSLAGRSIDFAFNTINKPVGFRLPPSLAGPIQTVRPDYGSSEWVARLRQRYPSGTPVSALLIGLGQQGFQVDLQNRRASYTYGVFAQRTDYCVSWTAENDGALVDEVSGFIMQFSL